MHNVCMVSDFFYPNMGGVENHIFQLSKHLILLGLKVIMITHCYGNIQGIHYVKNIKVYYIPLLPFYNSCILPTLYASAWHIRNILITEKIDIVHGHSAFSALALEALSHANLLNLKTVFTEHSLIGFADASSIITNQLLKITLCNCNHIICVSHTSKQNTVLRADIAADKISVIPNAIDIKHFRPVNNASIFPNDTDTTSIIYIVVMCRLVYRKGINLLTQVIPKICRLYTNVNFIIGGNGPKRLELEEMKEAYQLDSRVEMLGEVPCVKVPEILKRGHIFLNTSLTEAFCMAILEACSCGLHVVSTRVGGIPEVLPPKFMTLVEPNVESIVSGLCHTIDKLRGGRKMTADMFPTPHECHAFVKQSYRWDDIAKRTLDIYNHVTRTPNKTLSQKLQTYLSLGPICGKLFAFIMLVDWLLLKLFDYFFPRHTHTQTLHLQTKRRKIS